MISVVIPAFNEERTIGACLSALAQQSLPSDRYEVIVVDDGSEDGTREVVARHGARLVESRHRGPAEARNLGVGEARGDIVVFTDADCEPAETFLEEMERPFLEDPRVMGVKGVYRTRQRELVARFAQVEFEDRYRRLARLADIDFVDSHAAAFRREAFQGLGGFDPHFPVANNEDVELSYKFAEAGHRMVFAPAAVVYHRHPSSAVAYLTTKLLRGYWRVKVYRRFPGKAVSDSYTPQTLKIQILLAGLLALAALGGALLPGLRWPAVILAALFCASCLPFARFAWPRDRAVALFSPLMLLGRSLVFGIGVGAALLSKERRDILIPALLVAGDGLAVTTAYLMALWTRTQVLGPMLPRFDHPPRVYLALLPFVFLIWFSVFTVRGLYRERRTVPRLTELHQVVRAAATVILILVAVSFFIKWDFSRPFVVLFALYGVIFPGLSRYAIRGLQWRMLQKGYNRLRALVVGCGETGRMVERRLSANPVLGYQVVGFVDEAGEPREEIEDAPYLGTTEEIARICREHLVDEVFIARPGLAHDRVLDLVLAAEDSGVSFKIVSDLFEIVTRRTTLDAALDLPVTDLREETHPRLRDLSQRAFDLALGLPLAALALPVIGLAALAVRLETPGPALVSREVVGRKGRRFRLLRLRTYRWDPEQPGGEGESTRLGRALLRRHMDELPQVFHVVKGEMSLVGPRPELPEIVAGYTPWQRKRLGQRPGITGLWQIWSDPDTPLHENLELDFYYMKNRSLLLDLTILIQTLPVVLLGRRPS